MAGGLDAVCFAYSLGAFLLRPSKRLAAHTVLYGAAMLHEGWHARAHFVASGR